MATYSNFYTVSVPAIGGTYSLPSDENWDLYLLTSNTGAAVTVTGVIDIVPTGTIIEGLRYDIIFDGTLTGTNTFTIFGNVLPNHLRWKKLSITCVYISGSWVVTIDEINSSIQNSRLPMKTYKARLSQSGTSAPTVTTEYVNTFGSLSFSRVSAGTYRIDFPAGSFPNFPTLGAFSLVSGFLGISICRPVSDYQIDLITLDYNGITTDSLLDETFILVETYNNI